jgi:hypothetical protein
VVNKAVDDAARRKMMTALIIMVTIIDLFMAGVFFVLFRFAMNLEVFTALALALIAGAMVAALAFFRFRGLMERPSFRMAQAPSRGGNTHKGSGA